MFDSLKKKLNSFIGDAKGNGSHQVSALTQIKAKVSGKAKLAEADVEDLLWKLHTDLLESDVSMESADDIIGLLKERLVGMELEGGGISQKLREAVYESLHEIITPEKQPDLLEEIRKAPKPYTILFLGVNGTGKTTTMAKLASLLMKENKTVVFAAGDTFRAGAIEQLTEHATRLNAKVISHQRGADAAAVIYDAIEHARARNIDVVLADTAGRMQSKSNLMDELEKIIRVNKPNLKILVLDGLAGNDAIEQANTFNQIVGFDGAILTKMDADAKGGAAISAIHSTKKPIIYVGVGQSYDDLQKFNPEWFLKKILD
jgi:fused signal recognition particle receptor